VHSRTPHCGRQVAVCDPQRELENRKGDEDSIQAEQRAPDSMKKPRSIPDGEEDADRQEDPDRGESRKQEIRFPGQPQVPGVEDVNQQKRRHEEMEEVGELKVPPLNAVPGRRRRPGGMRTLPPPHDLAGVDGRHRDRARS